MNPDGTFRFFGSSVVGLLGYSVEESLSLRLENLLTPASFDAVKKMIGGAVIGERSGSEGAPLIRTGSFEMIRKDGTRTWVESKFTFHVNRQGQLDHIAGVSRDITDRKRLEQERDDVLKLLEILQRSSDTKDLARSLGAFLQKMSGCEAVGIRLREGEDFPYYETSGFPPAFVLAENRLCAADEKGEMLRDGMGNPVIECMCGNILCGRFNPELPFFTQRGSFWSNCTTELLASTREADRQARTRNRCNGEGYESVALIALRACGETYGLLQFNDKRRGRFTPGLIDLLEHAANHIALAFSQRLVQESLDKATERYRIVADNTYDWELWWAPEREMLYCSPSCERITGYNREAFMADSDLFKQIVHPDDRDAFQKHLEEHKWERAPSELEYRIVRSDGETRWVGHACRPVFDTGGRFMGTRVSNRDISKSKQAEEALRKSEERFRLIASSTPDHLIMQDRDLRYSLVVNPQLGLAERDMIGKTDYDFLLKEDADKLTTIKKQVLDTGRPVCLELSLRSRTGEQETFDGSYVPTCGADGRVDGLIGYFRNVTEHKRSEEAICESERRYRSLFDSSVDGILMTIPDGQVLDANPAACAMFGMTRDEICRAGREGLVEKDERLAVALRERERTGRFSGELTYIRKNGAPFPGEVTSVAFQDSAGAASSFVMIRDITLRKLAVDALSDSENLFRTLSEKSMAGIYVVQDGVFKFVNPNAASYAGCGPAEMIGMPAESLIHAEDRMRSRENAFKMLHGELDSPYEFRVVTQQGETRWILETVSPIIYEGKRAILGNSMDITVLKLAAEALRLSEERYRQIVDTASEGIWAMDGQQLTNFVNARMAEMLGCTPGEMIGQPIEAFMFAEDLEDHAVRMKALRQGEPGRYEHRFRTKDGGMLWTIVSANALMNKEGRFAGSFAMFTDITERKQAEEALRDSEEKFRLLAEHATDMIARLRPDGTISYVSPSSGSALGYEPGELADRSVYNFVHPEDAEEFARNHQIVLENTASVTLSFRLRRKDGSWGSFEAIAKGLRDDTGTVTEMIAVARDVNERKRAEEAIKDRNLFLQTLIETIPLPVFFKDRDGVYQGCNKAFEALWGPREQVIGKTVYDVSPHEIADVYSKADIELLSNPGVQVYETVASDRNGEKHDVVFNKATYLDSSGNVAGLIGAIFDITERKRIEEALRESESHLNLALHSAGMGTWNWDIVGDRRHFDGQAWQLLGIDAATFTGTAEEFSAAVHREDRETLRTALDRTLQLDVRYEPEYRVVWPDGSIHHITARGRLVRDHEGRPVRIDGVMWDITSRKQMEIALRESERKYRSLISSMTEGVALHEIVYNHRGDAVDYRIIDVNPAYEKHTGILSGQARGTLACELYGTRSAPFLDLYVSVAEGGPTQTLEIQFAPMGKHFRVSVTSPRLGWFATIFEDVTERKHYEDSLRSSEEQYRHLFENALEGMFRSTPEGRYLKVNPALAQMFGYGSPEEMIEQVTDIGRELYVDFEERARCVRILQEDGTLRRFEVQLRRRDGSIMWAIINSRVVRDEAGTVLYIEGMISNISDLKRAEEALKESERRLRQAQKMEAIGTLAGGIAHDFNNILAAIIGYTEMSQCSSVTKKQILGNLEQVLKASLRAKDLIKQILAFSRQGDQELRPILIHPLLKEAARMLRASLPATIQIRQNIRAGGGAILGDPTQIHQIVMNLATNAAHAMHEKGGIMGIGLQAITLEARDAETIHTDLHVGRYLKLTVSDTGHGIEPSVLHRIFDPFFTTKDPGEGTGMGLAVAHGIVKSHGGVITVDSEPGKGTEFRVYFPAMESEPTRDASESAMRDFGKAKGRVLFVDDEEALVLLSGQLLSRLGYEVVTRTSSLEALEAFRANPDRFDLVITDQTMPQMTGIELAQEMMRIRPDIPIILCTGFSEAVTPEKAKSVGIREYLMKPLVMRQMADTISRILDRQGELRLQYGTRTDH